MGVDVESCTPPSESVECYSGYTYAEKPKSFTYQGQRFKVTHILESWRVPEGLRFHVVGDDDSSYELCFDQQNDIWHIRRI